MDCLWIKCRQLFETGRVPGTEMAVAGLVAVSWLPVTKAVAAPVPFQFTTAFLSKAAAMDCHSETWSTCFRVVGGKLRNVGRTPGCGDAFLGERSDLHDLLQVAKPSRHQSSQCQVAGTF